MSLRERRIANELALLQALVDRNPNLVRMNGSTTDEFDVTLSGTTGLVRTAGGCAPRSAHQLILRFPRYFPALPIEAYFKEPIFHPNVDPVNGFVCLWLEPSPRHTVFHALQVAQAVITFRTQNVDPRHVTQPDAVSGSSPLPFVQLICPSNWQLQVYEMQATSRRRRLTSA